MEVLEVQSILLSNKEVLIHLEGQKEDRNKISKSIGRDIKVAENVYTIEFETISYFEKECEGLTKLSLKGLKELLEYLSSVPLTKGERLQIVNLLPKTEVELYLIIEECEERLEEKDIMGILKKINEILNSDQ